MVVLISLEWLHVYFDVLQAWVENAKVAKNGFARSLTFIEITYK